MKMTGLCYRQDVCKRADLPADKNKGQFFRKYGSRLLLVTAAALATAGPPARLQDTIAVQQPTRAGREASGYDMGGYLLTTAWYKPDNDKDEFVVRLKDSVIVTMAIRSGERPTAYGQLGHERAYVSVRTISNRSGRMVADSMVFTLDELGKMMHCRGEVLENVRVGVETNDGYVGNPGMGYAEDAGGGTYVRFYIIPRSYGLQAVVPRGTPVFVCGYDPSKPSRIKAEVIITDADR